MEEKTEWLGSSAVVLEIVPPPLRLGEKGVTDRIARIAKINAESPFAAVNIPEIRDETSKNEQGARKSKFEQRVDPREMARRLQDETGITAIINRVVVHLEENQQSDWFRETHEDFGVRNFILVGGERAGVAYPGPTVSQANRLIGESLAGKNFTVGNIAIPSRRRQEGDEPDRMAAKASAGAQFFSTQIVYHLEEITSLLEDLQTRPDAVDKPLLLSLCPVRNPRNFGFLRWLGVNVSEELETQLAGNPDQTLANSISHLVKMWSNLRAFVADHNIRTPIGLNIAPVGPIPVDATIELMQRLDVELPRHS